MSRDSEAISPEEDAGRAFSGNSDSSLVEEIEDLRRYCQSIGISASAPENEDDSDLDDFDLVQDIQKSFPLALSLRPLNAVAIADSEEDEDDFETLRAIQRRFAAYGSGTPKSVLENYVDTNEQVRASSIAPDKETSTSLFLNETNSCKGCPDTEDACKKSWNSEDKISGNQFSGSIDWHEAGSNDACKSSSFPKVAQFFVDAIRRNRACQKFLRNKLIHIEAMLEENKNLKERAKILKDFQNSCKKRTSRALSQKKDPHVQLISAPKTRFSQNPKGSKKPSSLNYGPQANFLVEKYNLALSKFPIFLTHEKWSREERENIVKGIRQQFQQMSFQMSVDLWSETDGFSGDVVNFDELMESIVNFEIMPEHIRLFLPRVDWNQLGSMYAPNRSGAECEARWLNWESPLINHGGWTADEDRKLLHIVQQKGFSDWFDTASLLGTGRTAFQCLARFQRSLNAFIMKSEWTEEEDAQLRKAVEVYGESDWQLVASTLDGRTGPQCSNRWMKTLHPMRKKEGRWSEDEDKCMRVAVTLLGHKWHKVATFVPGRTQVQCRERWVNCLSPSLRLDAWTEAEDSKLEDAIREHGYCWSKIASCVPPRTDSQCRRRWMFLFPDEVPLLRAEKSIKKVALISNFVDRESERPTLGANDFVPNATLLPAPAPKRGNRKRKLKLIGNCVPSGDFPKRARSRRSRSSAIPEPGTFVTGNSEEVHDVELSRSENHAMDELNTQGPERGNKSPPRRRTRVKRSFQTEELNSEDPNPIQSMKPVTKKKLHPKRHARVKKSFSIDKSNGEDMHVVEASGSRLEVSRGNDNCRVESDAADLIRIRPTDPLITKKLSLRRRPKVKKPLQTDNLKEHGVKVARRNGGRRELDIEDSNAILSSDGVTMKKLISRRCSRAKKLLQVDKFNCEEHGVVASRSEYDGHELAMEHVDPATLGQCFDANGEHHGVEVSRSENGEEHGTRVSRSDDGRHELAMEDPNPIQLVDPAAPGQCLDTNGEYREIEVSRSENGEERGREVSRSDSGRREFVKHHEIEVSRSEDVGNGLVPGDLNPIKFLDPAIMKKLPPRRRPSVKRSFQMLENDGRHPGIEVSRSDNFMHGLIINEPTPCRRPRAKKSFRTDPLPARRLSMSNLGWVVNESGPANGEVVDLGRAVENHCLTWRCKRKRLWESNEAIIRYDGGKRGRFDFLKNSGSELTPIQIALAIIEEAGGTHAIQHGGVEIAFSKRFGRCYSRMRRDNNF